MTPQEVMAALKAAAKPGSRAASLFATGTASAAPAGPRRNAIKVVIGTIA